MDSSVKNGNFAIETLTSGDLDDVRLLQPEGWGDILSYIQYYCVSDFCFPLKATVDGMVAGIGTAIIYGDTAWLGHIIVHKDHRNAGVGTKITKALIDVVHKTPCRTIMLIATSLGEPIYKKVGFEVQTQYVFLEDGELPIPDKFSKKITGFDNNYEAMLQLDRSISGEDRKKLFKDHVNNASLFTDNKKLKGFYISTLGEGLIVADSTEAGFALMNIKSKINNKFCIPIDNEAGINYLTSHGYKESRRASRMIMGQKLTWHGSKLYGRIGGNLG